MFENTITYRKKNQKLYSKMVSPTNKMIYCPAPSLCDCVRFSKDKTTNNKVIMSFIRKVNVSIRTFKCDDSGMAH